MFNHPKPKLSPTIINQADKMHWLEWVVPIIITVLIFCIGIFYQFYILRDKRRTQFKDDLNLFTKSVNKLITDSANTGDIHKKIERIWYSVMEITSSIVKKDKKVYYVSYYIFWDKRNKFIGEVLSSYTGKLTYLGRISMNNSAYEKLNQDFSICLATVIKNKCNKATIKKAIEDFDASIRGQVTR